MTQADCDGLNHWAFEVFEIFTSIYLYYFLGLKFLFLN